MSKSRIDEMHDLVREFKNRTGQQPKALKMSHETLRLYCSELELDFPVGSITGIAGIAGIPIVYDDTMLLGSIVETIDTEGGKRFATGPDGAPFETKGFDTSPLAMGVSLTCGHGDHKLCTHIGCTCYCHSEKPPLLGVSGTHAAMRAIHEEAKILKGPELISDDAMQHKRNTSDSLWHPDIAAHNCVDGKVKPGNPLRCPQCIQSKARPGGTGKEQWSSKQAPEGFIEDGEFIESRSVGPDESDGPGHNCGGQCDIHSHPGSKS